MKFDLLPSFLEIFFCFPGSRDWRVVAGSYDLSALSGVTGLVVTVIGNATVTSSATFVPIFTIEPLPEPTTSVLLILSGGGFLLDVAEQIRI